MGWGTPPKSSLWILEGYQNRSGLLSLLYPGEPLTHLSCYVPCKAAQRGTHSSERNHSLKWPPFDWSLPRDVVWVNEPSLGPLDTGDKHTCPVTLITWFPREITSKSIQIAFQKHWAVSSHVLLIFEIMSKAEISGMTALGNWDFKWFWPRRTDLPVLIWRCDSRATGRSYPSPPPKYNATVEAKTVGQGFLSWHLWTEFFVALNLDGKTFLSLFSLTSNWNLACPLGMSIGHNPC